MESSSQFASAQRSRHSTAAERRRHSREGGLGLICAPLVAPEWLRPCALLPGPQGTTKEGKRSRGASNLTAGNGLRRLHRTTAEADDPLGLVPVCFLDDDGSKGSLAQTRVLGTRATTPITCQYKALRRGHQS